MSTEINSGKQSSLIVKPLSVYFGCVKQGSASNVKLLVNGGPGKVFVNNDQLRVTPSSFGNEEAEIHVDFLGGIEGELIWDFIIFQAETNEIKIPVIGYWERGPAQVSPPINMPTPIPDDISETRMTKGHVCSLCSRNFIYDVNNHTWEQCNCNWNKKLVRISTQIFKEFRIGIKAFPSYVKEMWSVIIGKERW